jgi:hypothetical protein
MDDRQHNRAEAAVIGEKQRLRSAHGLPVFRSICPNTAADRTTTVPRKDALNQITTKYYAA